MQDEDALDGLPRPRFELGAQGENEEQMLSLRENARPPSVHNA